MNFRLLLLCKLGFHKWDITMCSNPIEVDGETVAHELKGFSYKCGVCEKIKTYALGEKNVKDK